MIQEIDAHQHASHSLLFKTQRYVKLLWIQITSLRVKGKKNNQFLPTSNSHFSIDFCLSSLQGQSNLIRGLYLQTTVITFQFYSACFPPLLWLSPNTFCDCTLFTLFLNNVFQKGWDERVLWNRILTTPFPTENQCKSYAKNK